MCFTGWGVNVFFSIVVEISTESLESCTVQWVSRHMITQLILRINCISTSGDYANVALDVANSTVTASSDAGSSWAADQMVDGWTKHGAGNEWAAETGAGAGTWVNITFKQSYTITRARFMSRFAPQSLLQRHHSHRREWRFRTGKQPRNHIMFILQCHWTY